MVVLSGVVAMVAAACGANDGSDSATASANSDVVVTEPSPSVEAVLVPTASGAQLDFNSLRGQDVLLWFWAPW